MSRRRRTVLGWAGAAAIAALFMLALAPVALADGGWVYTGSFGSPGSGPGQFGAGVVGNVVYDGHGLLYVADHDHGRIEQWTTAGSFVTAWGSMGSGDGQFLSPFALSLSPDGAIYVSEEAGTRVQKLSTSGVYQSALDATFAVGLGVATDSTGATWASEYTANQVTKFDADGEPLFVLDGSSSGTTFFAPTGLAVDNANDVYVADYARSRVVVFDQNGNYLRQWDSVYPWSIAVDHAGHVFVAGISDGITEYNRAGLELGSFGQGRFSGAIYGLAVDGKGHLWATDGWGSKVEEYSWDQPAITTDADNDWHSQDTVVHFSATDAVSGVKTLEYSTDGGGTWHQDDAVAIGAPADHANDGAHPVQVRATSNDGNTATATFRVKIDTKAPLVSASGPIDQWMTSPQQLWFAASDVGSGVADIGYTVDGGPPMSVGDDGSITISGDGHHVVTYWAADNCVDTPNMSLPQTADVYLDSVAPKVATLSNVVVAYGKKASFRFTVNDGLSSSCWVELRIAKKGKLVKLVEVGSRPSKTTAQTMSWTCKLPRGAYTWQATAYDMAGNGARGALKKLTVK